MIYSDPTFPAKMAELNAECMTLTIHREAEARREGFWRIYAGDKLLGSGVTKKDAWLAAWRNVRPAKMALPPVSSTL
ncbi:MAG: hypothetical protein AABN95_15960 [Acidobacteriota bacterium]